MIIDCDTHYLPADAYDTMGAKWGAKRPHFIWDDKQFLTGVDFPGAPPPVRADLERQRATPAGRRMTRVAQRSMFNVQRSMFNVQSYLQP